jgi:hypothetical protein
MDDINDLDRRQEQRRDRQTVIAPPGA